MRSLIARLNSDYVLVSYNDEGILSETGLRSILDCYCSEVTFQRIPFRRFRADTDGPRRSYTGDATHEFLILGRMRRGVQLSLTSLERSFARVEA